MLTVKQNPTKAEALYIAKNLRQQEVNEIESFNASPVRDVLTGVKGSKLVFCVYNGEEPIALVGLCEYPYEEDAGLVWLMTTEAVKNNSIAFVHIIRDLIETHGSMYSKLISFVDLKATTHQKFNNIAGFTLTDEIMTCQKTGMQFLVFELITTKGLEALYYSAPKEHVQ